MPNKKVSKSTEELFDQAKDLRDITVESVKNKLFNTIDPEVNSFILKEMRKEAERKARLNEIHEDLEDDLENPVPDLDDEEVSMGDDLQTEPGSEAEDVVTGKDKIGDDMESSEITEPIPTESELDAGETEIIAFNFKGQEGEAEVGEGDQSITFRPTGEKMVDLKSEPTGDDMPLDDELPVEGKEEKIDMDIPGEPSSEEIEFEKEEEDPLKLEVLNRIRRKRESGSTDEEILDAYRNAISQKLHEKLATNVHNKNKKKPNKKVTVEEHLKNRNLIPGKVSNKDILTEQEQRELEDRLASLMNLTD